MTPGYSTKAFEKKYTYAGRLGSVWTPERTDFRLWAPTAQEAEVRLYAGGREGEDDLLGRIPMRRDVNGTWVCAGVGDLNGVYYTYAVTVDGELREAVDPYARAVGVNGRRGMVIDLRSTDPEGWEEDRPPRWGEAPTDAVIYEVHVRDLSADESSGIKNRGLFAGLGETGTRTPGGAATGLDHIRQLGVTHVQLLPVYDYDSVAGGPPVQLGVRPGELQRAGGILLLLPGAGGGADPGAEGGRPGPAQGRSWRGDGCGVQPRL